MKKITLAVMLLATTWTISAQIFLGTLSYTGSTLQFKIKPSGGNITTAIGYFEFSIRYTSSKTLTYNSLTANVANTNPATGFPGLGIAESSERIIGGIKYKRFIATVTIPTQTYRVGTEYKVFEINLSGTDAITPFDLQLATNFDSGVPNDYYFVVSDGSGNPLVDVTGVTNFYPTQTKNGSDVYFSLTNIVLPVELLNFEGQNTEGGNLLTWQTASEINTSHFAIERSNDGIKFNKIGELKAQNKATNYNYLDKAPSGGWGDYYRLTINDLDGKTNISKIISIENNSDKSIKITQNREGSILIETTDKIELITLTNTIGQLIKSTKDKQFLINDLNAGIYIISVKTDKGFLSQKIFKN